MASNENMNSQVCQVCGDNVGLDATGEPFVACHECGFPVCRPCHQYERDEGSQCCLHCKAPYQRHEGNDSLLLKKKIAMSL